MAKMQTINRDGVQYDFTPGKNGSLTVRGEPSAPTFMKDNPQAGRAKTIVQKVPMQMFNQADPKNCTTCAKTISNLQDHLADAHGDDDDK